MERANTPCDGVAVAGRLLIALLDTLTILLLFLLGRRLYGAAGGLLAAGLYALTAQAVQLSHFFAMDPASTTFTVLSVYGGVLMVQERSWRGVLYAGIGAGLAISTKFSALPILAAPVAAALIVLWQAGARSPHVADGERGLDGVGRMLVGRAAGAFAGLRHLLHHQPLRGSRLGEFHPGYPRRTGPHGARHR